MPHVLVIGGGITGLSAAHRIVETGHTNVRVSLTEASSRLGGAIDTIERDGFLLELGPDSFLTTKPALIDLCRRIGIEDRVTPTHTRFRRSYVVFREKLHPLPDGFLMMAPTRFMPFARSPLFTWTGKFRMAMDLVLPRGGADDESLGAFVVRRMGREALERVVQPLVGGIYTGDPHALSLRATMPRFVE
ncbi:MAG: protoporphyrinogen oxidase, partial [candidate division Zixibacteria bacterium]|nr:protoporphyrinogen oxidase [candidate division Zixibacteria bacterium]